MMNTIKRYLLIGLGALVGVLMIVVKILAGRNSRLSAKLETADARIHRSKVLAKETNEIEEKFQSRRAEAMNEIKTTGGSSTFRDPNKLRNKGGD